MTRFHFVGPKGFVGIPARDLTDAEFRALPAMDRRRVRESSAYHEIEEPALTEFKRDELNAKAAEMGVPAPDKLKKKDEVIAAIEAVQTTTPAPSGNQEGAS